MVIASPPTTAAAALRVAAVLRRATRGLADWRRPPSPCAAPGFELHAEAGAPEGALHIDGVPVGSAPARR